MIERDYIMRLVQQLAAVVARLLRLKEQKEYEQALREVENAYGELLGLSPAIVPMFDVATLAPLLGHSEKMKAIATLFCEQAELYGLKQEPEQAERFYHCALEMFLEALLARQEEDTDCRNNIRKLLDLVEVGRLAPKYQDALRRFKLLNDIANILPG